MQTGKASTSNVVRPSNIEVRPTHLRDVAELSVTMRQEDRDEIWHLARKTPEEALRQAYLQCNYNRTVLLDGEVVCIFGVGGKQGEVGIPWMLASPLLLKIRKQFLRESLAFLDEMSEGHTFLYNIAWTKNTEHIRWLRWLGFTFKEPQQHGPDGEFFIEFYKVIQNV